MNNLQYLSKRIKYDLLKLLYIVGSGHPGSCLSIIDILIILYYNILNLSDNKLISDKFLLSKGHASPALYIVMLYKNILKKEDIQYFRTIKSKIQSGTHINMGFDNISGSLGQNLSVACGYALNAKLKNLSYKTYVLLGDGEMQEGQIWEAMAFAKKHKLNNLIGIIDNNYLQSTDTVASILETKLELIDKILAFGWNVYNVNGHDLTALHNVFNNKIVNDKPTMIIADTIKGKGISFMENKVEWHNQKITKEHFEKICIELSINDEVSLL